MLPNGDAKQSSPLRAPLDLAIAQAHRLVRLMEERKSASTIKLAEAVGVNPSQFRRRPNLTLLGPHMARIGLDGDEPDGLSLKQLVLGVLSRREEHKWLSPFGCAADAHAG